MWDEWISAQASSQSNRYQFSSICSVGLELPEQITAGLLLASLNLEIFTMLRESVCCTTILLAVGASWKPYNNSRPPQCWLEAPARCRSLWGQSTGHNKEIPTEYEHPPFTSVWAVLALCLTDPNFTLALVQSKVNATAKQCGGCAHFGVKIKGTDFLNGPGGDDP